MRNEDYDRELLVAVTLICAALAAGVSLLETTRPTVAETVNQARSQLEPPGPVRIIGTPFVPNTNPNVR
jgi:curli biogenesis system outer membrane secretion channel CsgG